MIDLTTIRVSEPGDADALAELHAEAWRYAYRGIIPGVALERMIARRGLAWVALDAGIGTARARARIQQAHRGLCRIRPLPDAE